MKTLWFHICVIVSVYTAPDNQGKEFIICFMDNQALTAGEDLELYITTSSTNPVDVNVTTPLYDPTFLVSEIVERGTITTVTIPEVMRGSGTSLENKGVNVEASDEITVYAINKGEFSTDAFAAYPVDTLGTDYFVATWMVKSSFMIVATENGTDVNITFSSYYTDNDITFGRKTYSSGEVLRITLNKWQTFHVHSNASDLTGTRITSSEVVAVMSGAKKTSVEDTNTKSTSDHLVEQMVPVQSWGKEYITISTPERIVGDYIRIISSEDNTTVTLSPSSSTILNAGEFVQHNVNSGETYYVTADKGIMVAMYSKTQGEGSTGDAWNGGDPSMVMLVPVPLFGYSYTFSTVEIPDYIFTNYLAIVTKSSAKDDIALDGVYIRSTATWTSVVGASDYVTAWFSVSSGVHTVYNTDPTATFMGIAFGNAHLNSYAYSSGSRLTAINAPCNVTVAVVDDGLDNDCDGKIDEEKDNGIDDDGDGLVDEDTVTYSGSTETEDASSETLSTKMILIIAGSGLAAVGMVSLCACWWYKLLGTRVKKLKSVKSNQVEENRA